MRSMVLTLIADDRPGLVEALAAAVARCGGNWIESRMARLAGQFAGLVRVELPEASRAALEQALESVTGRGVRLQTADGGVTSSEPARLVALELTGADHPGILAGVTRVLALHHVNIEELETECVSAPMSGDRLFRARARLGLPAGLDEATLHADLERIASDLMVDLELR